MSRVRGRKRPSFFKVLVRRDFRRLIRLPRSFLQKHGSVLPKNIKLKISSTRTWDVKVEEKEDGEFCLTQGWKKFSTDVGLKFGEFLVFFFDCESTLEVLVYGTNACKKEFPGTSLQVENSDSDSGIDTDGDDDEEDVASERQFKSWKKGNRSIVDKINPLYCEIVLKLNNRSRMTLLKRFARAAGLVGKEEVEMEYVGSKYQQSVELDNREGGRVDMARGWPEFRKDNNLVYGKRYSFEFKPTKNLILVEEVKD